MAPREKAKDIKKALETARTPVSRGAAWIPTGSLLLDIVVGAGRGVGFETGMLVTFPGKSSGGKSLVCAEVIANAKYLYGDKLVHVYNDCESGFTFDTQALYGMDIMPFDPSKRTRSSTVEDCYGSIMTFLKGLQPGQFGIYIVDSLDGLMSAAGEARTKKRLEAFEEGKEFDEGTYAMEKQKFLSQEFFPNIAREAEQKNCLVIITMQLRDNVGAGKFEKKEKVSGGQAAYFYSHIQLWTQQVHDITVKGRRIGGVLKLWTVKAKGPKPYRTCYVPVYYDRGIDDVGANVDYLFDLRTPEGDLKAAAEGNQKTKARELTFQGRTAVGRQAMIELIEDNDWEKDLAKAVMTKWAQEEAEASKQVANRKPRFGRTPSDKLDPSLHDPQTREELEAQMDHGDAEVERLRGGTRRPADVPCDGDGL